MNEKYKVGDWVRILSDAMGRSHLVGMCFQVNRLYEFGVGVDDGGFLFGEIEPAGPYAKYHAIAREICGSE